VHYVHSRDPERLERVVWRHQASGSDRPRAAIYSAPCKRPVAAPV